MFKHSTKIVAAVAGVAMLAAPFMSVGSAMAASEIPQYADLSHVSLYETSSQKEVVNLLKASFDSGNGTATVYAQDFSNSNTFALGIRVYGTSAVHGDECKITSTPTNSDQGVTWSILLDNPGTAYDHKYTLNVWNKTQSVDKTKLTTLVNTAKTLKSSDYTKDSWTPFQKALDNAEFTLAEEKSTKRDVDNAFAALQTAQTGLKKAETTPTEPTNPDKPTKPAGSKDALKALIENVSKLNEKDYTSASWGILVNAVFEGSKVVDNDAATQSDVDNVVANINTALNDLVKAVTHDITKEVLKQVLDGAALIKKDDYTKDSYDALTKSVENAQKVYDNKEASQQEIDDAYNDLLDKTLKLKRVNEKPNESAGDSQNKPVADKKDDKKADSKELAQTGADAALFVGIAVGLVALAGVTYALSKRVGKKL